jgi:DNA-binding CsgD family transcriptional regulator
MVAAAPLRTVTAPGASPERELTIPPGLWPELSDRERELVQLILTGHPTATIAGRLAITVGTAKNHRRRIYEKLDITTERRGASRATIASAPAPPWSWSSLLLPWIMPVETSGREYRLDRVGAVIATKAIAGSGSVC